MLWLSDVGRGYVIGDDSGCGGLGTENAPPSVAQLAITYYPVPGCFMEFERVWHDRRPTPARGAPHLGITVYWIGRRFEPRRGLPSLRLAYVEAALDDRESAENGEGPGYRADLDYQGRRDGLVLDVWRLRRWERFRRSKGGTRFWDKPCVRKRVVALRSGHAELFRSCARRRARFVAHAYLRGVVVEVSPYCLRCGSGGGAYGSFKGLAKVVRALHPRRRRS